MCGVLGISRDQGSSWDFAPEMLDEISHRGPDDSGLYYSDDSRVCLGHVRLSIIDVSDAGHQPMTDGAGRFTMVYNGEVYNYEALRSEIENRHGRINWNSSSDSEVILEGFAREGSSFFERLNGIFSILVFDSLKGELHVVRDPIGVKPLYVTEQNGAIMFCSELKGLLKLKGVKKTLRRQSLADQLAFMYVPEPFTLFEEFKKVEPGTHSIYKEGRLISENKIFKFLHKKTVIGSESEAISQFGTLFSQSVKRQLVSDVPVSLFLSGGLDSSAVAYEVVHSGAKVHSAYTISYSKKDQKLDGQSPDLLYAEKVAKKLGLDLRVIEANSNFMDLLPDLIDFMEDGISDPAAINTYLISKSAREEGIKVMLSGQGADEYLCGYRRYLAESYLESMNPLLKGFIATTGSMFPDRFGKSSPAIRRLKRVARAAKEDRVDRLSSYFMWTAPDSISRLFMNPESVSPGENLKDSFKNLILSNSSLNSLLKADQQFDLLSLNLAYSDKMSMAVGLELRVPFLDFELVQFMNSLPEDMKLNGRTQKYILKKAMEGRLPKEVIYRSKAGFALPIRSWFRERNPIFDYYFDYKRIEKQGIFNPHEISSLYKTQLEGKKDNSYILFAVLCQQIWIEKNC